MVLRICLTNITNYQQITFVYLTWNSNYYSTNNMKFSLQSRNLEEDVSSLQPHHLPLIINSGITNIIY